MNAPKSAFVGLLVGGAACIPFHLDHSEASTGFSASRIRFSESRSRVKRPTLPSGSSSSRASGGVIELRQAAAIDPTHAIQRLCDTAGKLLANRPKTDADAKLAFLYLNAWLEGACSSGVELGQLLPQITDEALRKTIEAVTHGSWQHYEMLVLARYDPASLSGKETTPDVWSEAAITELRRNSPNAEHILRQNPEIFSFAVAQCGCQSDFDKLWSRFPDLVTPECFLTRTAILSTQGTFESGAVDDPVQEELRIHAPFVSGDVEMAASCIEQMATGTGTATDMAGATLGAQRSADFLKGFTERVAISPYRGQFLATYGEPLARSLAALPEGPALLASLEASGPLPGLSRSFANELAKTDPGGALQLLAHRDDRIGMAQVLSGLVKEDRSYEDAAVGLLNSNDLGEDDSRSLARSLSKAAMDSGLDVSEGAARLASIIQSPEIRQIVMNDVVKGLVSEDPVAASALAAGMERGASYDECAALLVENITDDDDARRAWAESIADPKLRASLLEQLQPADSR